VKPVAVSHIVEGPADAPLLVLSGSLGATLRMWDPQAVALRERYRVVRYDTRGHGGSPVPRGPYTLGDLGVDVVALLDQLGVERAHVCGTSLGGMTAMWLGIHAPERIERLVLCCTSAQLGPPKGWVERAATVRAHGAGAVAPAVVSRWLTDPFKAANPELVARLEEMVAGTSAEGYAACCEAIEVMDLVPRLGEIRAPTLVITAAEDPATPPEHGERIAAGIPGARLERLERAAHLASIERPAAVTALIREHLEA
jgi:3-oxoadipate enol-lactonase